MGLTDVKRVTSKIDGPAVADVARPAGGRSGRRPRSGDGVTGFPSPTCEPRRRV